jgi:hypothetical protein
MKASKFIEVPVMKVCLHMPTWLSLPDRRYERIGKWDALYCGDTEHQANGQLLALCDEHKALHWLGIYGDDELMKAYEFSRHGNDV